MNSGGSVCIKGVERQWQEHSPKSWRAPAYEVNGQVIFNGKDLLAMKTEERPVKAFSPRFSIRNSR